MKDSAPEILELATKRALPIVTVNGAYHWATKNVLFPAVQIVVDARPESAAFTHPVYPGTIMLICDTCDPLTFKGLKKKQTRRWSRTSIKGGSTVMLCAVPLLRWMGCRYLHIFGFDSCVTPTHHHAYEQSLNDGEPTKEVVINGKSFHCTHWMISQAEEFLELHGEWGDFKIYGDGLIAALVNQEKDFDVIE